MHASKADKILDRVCHTSQRTYEGITYTLVDLRYPMLQGWTISHRVTYGCNEWSICQPVKGLD